jgi:hypothetical protein
MKEMLCCFIFLSNLSLSLHVFTFFDIGIFKILSEFKILEHSQLCSFLDLFIIHVAPHRVLSIPKFFRFLLRIRNQSSNEIQIKREQTTTDE